LDNAYAAQPDTAVNISGVDFPVNAYISSVAVNPYDSDQIVCTFANYGIPSIFLTWDGGISWTDISGNLEENVDGSGSGPAVFWAEYYVDGTIFVGTSTGLYTTNFPDGNNTVWTLEPGIGNVPVDHMDFRTFDGYFVVGTHGQGIFSTNLTPGFIGMKEETKKLSVYPTLTIEFINIVSPVETASAQIFNLSGQLVYEGIVNKQTQVSVSHLQAGTYIVLVKSGNEKWTEKFIKR
jgi:hypothetical protein